MSEKPPKPYQRLPGTGYKQTVPGYVQLLLFFVIGIFVLLLRGRRVQLWTGNDHLLLVESNGAREYYKRYFYQDIQALLVRKTPEGRIINILLGCFMGLFLCLTAIADDSASRLALFILGAVFGLLLLTNTLASATCKCQLQTAVSLVDLPSLNRARTARKALALLRPRLITAQGQLSPDEIRDKLLHASTTATPAPVAQLIVDDPNLPPRMV